MKMDINARLDYLDSTLNALESSWPKLAAEIQSRIDRLTLKLISANDDETRGAIKELRDLLSLPESLLYERNHINSELKDD